MGLALCWKSLQSIRGGLADIIFEAVKIRQSWRANSAFKLDVYIKIKIHRVDYNQSCEF